MSIEQLDKIDLLGIDKVSGECVLTITDHLNWQDELRHFHLLQEKLNAYLRFIESGEVLESYPDSKGRQFRIDVSFKYKPKTYELINKMANVIENAGFKFTTEHLQ